MLADLGSDKEATGRTDSKQVVTEGPRYEMRVLGPLGLDMSMGVHLAIDGDTIGRLQPGQCSSEGCAFRAFVNSDLLNQLLAAKMVALRFSESKERHFRVDFDMSGFRDGMVAWADPNLLAWSQGLLSDNDLSQQGLVIVSYAAREKGSKRCLGAPTLKWISLATPTTEYTKYPRLVLGGKPKLSKESEQFIEKIAKDVAYCYRSVGLSASDHRERKQELVSIAYPPPSTTVFLRNDYEHPVSDKKALVIEIDSIILKLTLEAFKKNAVPDQAIAFHSTENIDRQ
jgi:hypothetical protein